METKLHRLNCTDLLVKLSIRKDNNTCWGSAGYGWYPSAWEVVGEFLMAVVQEACSQVDNTSASLNTKPQPGIIVNHSL